MLPVPSPPRLPNGKPVQQDSLGLRDRTRERVSGIDLCFHLGHLERYHPGLYYVWSETGLLIDVCW